MLLKKIISIVLRESQMLQHLQYYNGTIFRTVFLVWCDKFTENKASKDEKLKIFWK